MNLITDQKELEAFCGRLAGCEFLAIDTEFLRERTYWPRLCLVQVAGETDDQIAAIDALAPGIDLSPLFALLVDERIIKVFHAGRQDLEIFFHLKGIFPRPFFDTQIAAMVCGFGDSVSYEVLANKLAGAQIDKTSRFTDWSARPLTDRQIDYALSDVTHLRVIYRKLRDRLEKTDRTGWLEEEEATLLNPDTYRVDPDEAWRRLKIRTHKPRFLSVLKEVAAWRERSAQSRDVPRNRVIRDEAIVEIAAHAPTSAKALSRTRGLSEGLANGRVGQEIMDAVRRGLDIPAEDAPTLPPRPDIPRGIGPVVDLLRVVLKMKCDEHDVAQKLVANASDLERLAADDEADIPALHGWRREVFGETALAVKHGKLALTLQNRRLALMPLDGLSRGKRASA